MSCSRCRRKKTTAAAMDKKTTAAAMDKKATAAATNDSTVSVITTAITMAKQTVFTFKSLVCTCVGSAWSFPGNFHSSGVKGGINSILNDPISNQQVQSLLVNSISNQQVQSALVNSFNNSFNRTRLSRWVVNFYLPILVGAAIFSCVRSKPPPPPIQPPPPPPTPPPPLQLLFRPILIAFPPFVPSGSNRNSAAADEDGEADNGAEEGVGS